MFSEEKSTARYEQFVKSHPEGSFFQSRVFGDVQDKLPYRGRSWALLAQDPVHRILSGCLAIKMRLPFGFSWLWVPYGPLGYSDEIFEGLARIAEEEKSIFARVEPPAGWTAGDSERTRALSRVRPARSRFTPEHSLILDLTQSEEALLAQMKQKGRYNLNVAKRHGVHCRIFPNLLTVPERDFAAFYEILRKTGERDGFGIHPQSYYETLLEILGAHHMAALLLAYGAQGEVVAGIIVAFYKDTATYYYGGSLYGARQLMAPYMLQWEAVREARRRGMKHYDFLGIAPPDAKKHSFSGITDFKKKFGGVEVAYPAAFDLVYRPFMYAALRALRRV